MANREQRRMNHREKQCRLNRVKTGLVLQKHDENHFRDTMTVFLYAMHHKFGFGQKRLTEILDEVYKLGLRFHDQYISVDDMKQVLFDECGLDMSKY